MPQKHTNTQRFGGPGASHENAKTRVESKRGRSQPGQDKAGLSRNPAHSAISGGGGEADSHHTHSPGLKGAR